MALSASIWTMSAIPPLAPLPPRNRDYTLALFGRPTEVSVSGNGLHVFVTGDLPAGSHKLKWEVYGNKRFIALTLDFLETYPVDVLPERTRELCTLVRTEPSPAGGVKRTDRYISTLSDEEVLRRIMTNPSLWKRFRSLADSTGGGADKSELDWQLLALIGDYTCDVEQVERIFDRTTLGQNGGVRPRIPQDNHRSALHIQVRRLGILRPTPKA